VVEQDPQKTRTLQVVTTAANGAEADLIRQRLAEAGIPAISQRSIGGPEWGASGAQYIYVEAPHLERAREVLNATGELSDTESSATRRVGKAE
jgi:hypothetical protein